MDFGVVLQTNPPAWRTVAPREAGRGARLRLRLDLRLAPAVAGALRHLHADPRRDPPGRSSARWSPTRRPGTGRSRHRCSRPSTRCTATAPSAASAAATPRCGSLNGKPSTLKEVREATHVIRELGNCRAGRAQRLDAAVPLGAGTSALEVWVAAYGPLALKTAGEVGRRLHPPARRRRHREVDDQRRCATPRRRPAVTRTRSRSASPRPPTSASDGPRSDAHARRSAAGSAAWWATTSPTSSRSTARPTADNEVPAGAHRLHQGPRRLRLQQHGQADNNHVDFVPDEIVDRFCVLGTAERAHRQARGAQGDRRRPVRGLPPARQQGGDAAGLRRVDHAPPPRPRHGEGVTA